MEGLALWGRIGADPCLKSARTRTQLPLTPSATCPATLPHPCSATTFSVVQSFVKIAHAMRRTFVISLLQPPPEVVQLFDDILLLTDGRAVYQ